MIASERQTKVKRMKKSLCGICGGSREHRRVSIERWYKGQLLVVKNVPAEICARCGERFFHGDVAEFIYEKLRAREAPDEILSVPAWDFEKVAAG